MLVPHSSLGTGDDNQALSILLLPLQTGWTTRLSHSVMCMTFPHHTLLMATLIGTSRGNLQN